MPDFLAEVLTWPRNYYMAVAVETAYEMGIPPTSLLTDKQPSEPWSKADKKLVLAYTILQKETCQKCGQPLWICRSTNSLLQFKPRKAVCFASQELEKYGESKNGKNLKKGEYVYAVPVFDGDETNTLPSRIEYFERLNDD